MRRIGVGWCILVSLLVFVFIALSIDLSEPDSNLLLFHLLEPVEPRGLAVFLMLLAISLMLFLTAAVVRSAWNRIAPHILEGARTMTFAEGYAVVLVFGLLAGAG